MDDLTEVIASEIGPKWVQLLSKLKLEGYRDRYQILTKHKEEEKKEQEANCTRDTIRLWREGLEEVEENEAMAQLLEALKKVQGFDERAQDLAKSYGVCVDESQSVSTSSEDSEKTTEPHVGSSLNASDGMLRGDVSLQPPPPLSLPPHPPTTTASTASPGPPSLSTVHHHTSTPPHSYPSPPSLLHTPRQTHSDGYNESGRDLESFHDGLSSSHSISTPHNVSNSLSADHYHAPSHMLHSNGSADTSRDSEMILNSQIDISVWKHKYVLLDICQRLQCDLSELAARLGIKVYKVSEDKSMGKEEQFYQLLKAWLVDEDEEGKEEKEGKEEDGRKMRTFLELKEALEECRQETASKIILRRLLSPGLTLS